MVDKVTRRQGTASAYIAEAVKTARRHAKKISVDAVFVRGGGVSSAAQAGATGAPLGSASGEATVAEGLGEAFGDYSHAEGYGQTVGVLAHAEGSSAAEGAYSHSEGNATWASADGSHAEGIGAKALNDGEHAHASNYSPWGIGEWETIHQYSRRVVAGSSNGTSPAVISLFTFRAFDDGVISLPMTQVDDYNQTAIIRVRVIGRRYGPIGNYLCVKYEGVAHGDDVSTYTLTMPTGTVIDSSGASSWTTALSMVNNELQLTVTGATSASIEWLATVEIDHVG